MFSVCCFWCVCVPAPVLTLNRFIPIVGTVRTRLHIGHSAFLPALSSGTLYAVLQPGQLNLSITAPLNGFVHWICLCRKTVLISSNGKHNLTRNSCQLVWQR